MTPIWRAAPCLRLIPRVDRDAERNAAVLGTETLLLMFYLGFGFVILLGWAAIADELNRPLTSAARIRFRRLALVFAVAGLLHPAFALAGRDVAAQLARADGPTDPGADRVVQITNWAVVAAVGLAALVIVSHLQRFEDFPVMREIRDGLPFA